MSSPRSELHVGEVHTAQEPTCAYFAILNGNSGDRSSTASGVPHVLKTATEPELEAKLERVKLSRTKLQEQGQKSEEHTLEQNYAAKL